MTDRVYRKSREGGGGGGENSLMSGIRVCATDNQGQFFTSKNPEQVPNFKLFPEQALMFENLLWNRVLF